MELPEHVLAHTLARVAEIDESLARQMQAAFEALQLRERERASAMSKARHDIGNALAIAQASLEAMLDGVAPITDARLNRLQQILSTVSASVNALTDGGRLP